MVILKKIVIMTQYGSSNCSGIVKFENFAGRTSCFVRILGLKSDGVICMKCGDDIIYCGSVFDGEKSFNALYDLNKSLQIVVVSEGSIVCTGSNKGRFSPNSVMLEIHRYYANNSQAIDTSLSNAPQNSAIYEEKANSPREERRDAYEYVEETAQTQASDAVSEESAPQYREMPAQEIAKESVRETQQGPIESVIGEKKQAKTQTAEPFYKKIEDSLSKLFEAHDKDEELALLIPNSKWARIPVEGDGFYVVGIIENDGVPDIICYGVPDKDSSNPPQNSSDCRQWMELEKGGRGYWMMYQSAVSGQTLTTTII